MPGPAVFASGKSTGPAVVFVHGALGDCRQWTPIAGHLASSFLTVVLSRRFHWPNAPPFPNDTYTYESHRDDLLQYLQSLPREPVHLVGHSWGAGVVLFAALKEPGRVRSLTLIEPALFSVVPPDAPGFEPEAASRREAVATMRSFVQERQYDRAVEVLFDWLQGGPGGFGALPDVVRAGLLDNAETIGPTYGVPAPLVTCDQLRMLTVPTLVLTGGQTRPWFRLIGESFQACIPDAEAGTISGARHMVIVENPEAIAARLIGFLTRH